MEDITVNIILQFCPSTYFPIFPSLPSSVGKCLFGFSFLFFFGCKKRKGPPKNTFCNKRRQRGEKGWFLFRQIWRIMFYSDILGEKIGEKGCFFVCSFRGKKQVESKHCVLISFFFFF